MRKLRKRRERRGSESLLEVLGREHRFFLLMSHFHFHFYQFYVHVFGKCLYII
jgi:hypothetical protein